MNAKARKQDRIERSRRLLARVRHKQLETARAGDVSASARYAERAKIVIRATETLETSQRLAS